MAEPSGRTRRSSFEREGWVHVRGLVDADACMAVQRALTPHFERTGAGRLLNAWETTPAVRHLAVAPPVVELVTELLAHDVVAFQTLDFRRGTEQDAHVDALFFDTLPRGRMCGVWVALEDVGPASGPLRLWPGTHRVDPLWGTQVGERPVSEVCADALGGLPEPVDVTMATGDVVVWAANLLHGGAPVTELGSTRWSQVTHFVATDHLHVSPLTSDPTAERYMVRDQLVDLATRRRVRPRMGGHRVLLEHGRGGLSRLHVGPGRGRHAVLRAKDLGRGAPTVRRWAAARSRRLVRRIARRPTAS